MLDNQDSIDPLSKNIQSLINQISNKPDYEKLQLIQNFLSSESSSGINNTQFVELIKGAEIKAELNDDWKKNKLIQNFLESEKSVGITAIEYAELIKGIEIKDDYHKKLLIQNFLLSERSAGITTIEFAQLIKGAEIKDDDNKRSSIENFLSSEKSVGITSKDFALIIKSAEFKNGLNKKNLIKNFLESERSEGINVEDFVEIIKSAEFEEDWFKEQLIDKFLKSERSLGINVEDFIKIIKSAEFKEDGYKKLSINKFLESERSPNMTPQDLANMIKEVGLQNRADLSTNLYVTKFSASENYIENFIDFTKALQPSEAMQCEFLKEFINKNQINQDNVMGLKPFIEGLQDNELALDIINNLSGKGILVNAKDTLSLVKNRSKKQYAFLTEIVGDKTLNDCISLPGILTLKLFFGEDLKVGDQPITVSDLISYCDIKNETSVLSAMFKPEFKQQLRDNFAPSAEILLYKPAELEKLNQLLGERGVSFDVKNHLLENAKLCDYLKEKVGDISEIDFSKTYQINFTNFGIEEEKKAEINTLFNELLKSNDPDKEGVAKFFSDLLGIAFSHSDGDKLKTFFKENKKELAHCFCDKELSKENFESLFTTISDGCFANIGAQFKKMLYGTMIKDEEAQILYAVADDKIFSGIINNHGSDIMFGNFSPINNAIINSYSLSPMALVKKLSEETMLTSIKSWEIIGKIAGDDKKNEISDKLLELCPNDTAIFDQKAKEIASYFIVKKTFGEEKIKDLESKNPQLIELGDLAVSPEPSRESSRESSREPSPEPSPELSPRGGCFRFSCLRR